MNNKNPALETLSGVQAEDEYTEYFDPVENPGELLGGFTAKSTLCNGIVETFLKHGATYARVRVEDTPYEINDLYDGLYAVTRKNRYIKHVEVKRANGRVVLIRKREVERPRSEGETDA